MLTGWLSCLYCSPQAAVVVKLLLYNFLYSPLFQVDLVAEEEVVKLICSLCPVSCTVPRVLWLVHQRLNR